MRKPCRCRRRQADQIKQFAHPLARAARRHQTVQAQRTAENLAHRHARIERCIRILEDHLHASAQRTDLRLTDVRDVLAVEHDAALGRFGQTHHHTRERRFAAAGFADQADRFAGEHVEIDAVHRAQDAMRLQETVARQDEVLGQSSHSQQRRPLTDGACVGRSAGVARWR